MYYLSPWRERCVQSQPLASSFLPKCLPAPTSASGQGWTTPPPQRDWERENDPTKLLGKGQPFGRTNTSVLTTDTENLSRCWYNWGMCLRGSQSPHPASGNRPSWPECLSFHSSLHTAGQSLTSLRAQELLLLEPWSHRTYHKAAQLKLLMSISGFGTVFAATTPKTTLFQGLKQVRQMIHTHMCFQTLLTSSCLKLLPGRRHLFI